MLIHAFIRLIEGKVNVSVGKSTSALHRVARHHPVADDFPITARCFIPHLSFILHFTTNKKMQLCNEIKFQCFVEQDHALTNKYGSNMTINHKAFGPPKKKINNKYHFLHKL